MRKSMLHVQTTLGDRQAVTPCTAASRLDGSYWQGVFAILDKEDVDKVTVHATVHGVAAIFEYYYTTT